MNDVEIISMWDKTDAEWSAARDRIGGSDIGTLAGLNPYGTLFSVYSRFMGFDSFSGNEATRWGHKLEGPVAEFYAEEMNVALVDWPVLFRSTKYEFMAANVDRFVVEASPDFPAGKVTRWESLEEPPGLLAIWEGKTGGIASPGKAHEWFQGPDSRSIPLTYACQGCWYMAVTGLRRVEYGALLGGHGFVERTLEWDDDLVADLIHIAESFWYNHIVPQIPPDVDGSDATEEALKAMYPSSKPGTVIEGGSELADAWREFEEKKELAKAAEADRKAARARIVKLIGDNEIATVDGVPIVSYRSTKEVEFFADKVFAEAYPGLAKEFTRKRAGHRVLLPVKA